MKVKIIKLLSLFILFSFVILCFKSTAFAAVDLAFKEFNKDMYDIYGIHNIKKPFNVNDPSTYGYQSSIQINGKTYYLNLSILKQGADDKFSLNYCLDGSYFVYDADISGGTRKRPSTLTYNTAKRGKTETQYLGFNLEGAYYDNPAYPWNAWTSSNPLRNWSFIKNPWDNKTLLSKYKLYPNGGTFSKENIKQRSVDSGNTIDLAKSIELGIYAKYIYFASKETVRDGGVSLADQSKSIYYGYKVGSTELKNKFNLPKPKVFGTSDTWQDYVYILTPPTNTTWGSGFMFYSNPSALQGVDYITIPLAPFRLIEAQTIEELRSNNITGCFLSHPTKVYNTNTKKYEMKTWVIRSVKDSLTTSGKLNIQIWLKQGVDDNLQFVGTGMGTKVFDDDVVFSPDRKYWAKEVTFPLPAKGTISGIFVIDGDSKSVAYNYVWRTDFDTLAYGSSSTSKETEFNSIPWNDIKSDYGITREK